MKKLPFLFLILLAPSQARAVKTIMEGICSTGCVVLVDTINARVDFSTSTYAGGVPNVGLFTPSNVEVSADSSHHIVLYSTGSIMLNGTSLGAAVIGSGGANYVAKFTGTSTIGNSLIYDNGKIGVGTANPAVIVHIKRDLGPTFGADDSLRLDSGVSGHPATLHLTDSLTSDGFINFTPSATAASRYLSLTTRAQLGDLAILGNGNVGFGTVTPPANFYIAPANTSNVPVIIATQAFTSVQASTFSIPSNVMASYSFHSQFTMGTAGDWLYFVVNGDGSNNYWQATMNDLPGNNGAAYNERPTTNNMGACEFTGGNQSNINNNPTNLYAGAFDASFTVNGATLTLNYQTQWISNFGLTEPGESHGGCIYMGGAPITQISFQANHAMSGKYWLKQDNF